MDSESEREKENLGEQTVSIWPWLASSDKAAVFKNPEYYVYKGPIDPNCATSHLHVWTGYYERYKVSMKQYHEHHQQSLERNKSRTKLRTENQKLKEQIEEGALRIASYEKLLKEKIAKEPGFQEVLKEEIDKSKDPNSDAYDLEFVLTPRHGKIHFRLKRKSGAVPPQVTKCVNNLQERMVEDYDPQIAVYSTNLKRRRSSTDEFFEAFLSQAVSLPKDDKDLLELNNTSANANSTADPSPVVLPERSTQPSCSYGTYLTVSLAKVVDWLKSAR